MEEERGDHPPGRVARAVRSGWGRGVAGDQRALWTCCAARSLPGPWQVAQASLPVLDTMVSAWALAEGALWQPVQGMLQSSEGLLCAEGCERFVGSKTLALPWHFEHSAAPFGKAGKVSAWISWSSVR